MYCKKCGGKIESYASNCPFCGEKVNQNSVEATYTVAEESQVKPRSVGKWILTFLLMAISPVNIIMLFIWSFGEGTKKDLTFRNWARSQLIGYLIVVVLTVVLYFALPAIAQLSPELVEILRSLRAA